MGVKLDITAIHCDCDKEIVLRECPECGSSNIVLKCYTYAHIRKDERGIMLSVLELEEPQLNAGMITCEGCHHFWDY